MSEIDDQVREFLGPEAVEADSYEDWLQRIGIPEGWD